MGFIVENSERRSIFGVFGWPGHRLNSRMIDYTTDIAEGMWSLIANDQEILDLAQERDFWADANLTVGRKRILMFIALFASYLGQIENDEEAKLFQDVLDKIELSNKVGNRVHSNNGDRAQFRALHWIAHHGAFARPYG